jgi:hypothetical protein
VLHAPAQWATLAALCTYALSELLYALNEACTLAPGYAHRTAASSVDLGAMQTISRLLNHSAGGFGASCTAAIELGAAPQPSGGTSLCSMCAHGCLLVCKLF